MLLTVIVFLSVCLSLALIDNNESKYTLDKTDDSFLLSVLKGSFLGNEFNVTEEQLNTFLNKKFCQPEKPGSENMLKNLRLYFHEDMPAEIYAKIHYLNLDFSFYARADIRMEDNSGIAVVRISDVKIGELPVPDFIIQNMLSDFAGSKSFVAFTDGALLVQTFYDYSFDTFGFSLHLERFEMHDGSVTCKTNNLTFEILKALKDYLMSERGQELSRKLFGHTLNELKNGAIDYLWNKIWH